MADYQERFLTFLARCTDVTEVQQVAFFRNGLDEPLKTDVELRRPTTLEDAMGLAHAFERRLFVVAAQAPPRSTSLGSVAASPPPQRFAKPSASTVTGTPHEPAPSRPHPALGTRFSRRR